MPDEVLLPLVVHNEEGGTERLAITQNNKQVYSVIRIFTSCFQYTFSTVDVMPDEVLLPLVVHNKEGGTKRLAITLQNNKQVYSVIRVFCFRM